MTNNTTDKKVGGPEPSEEEFGADRTQRCVDLMRPEVKALLGLPLKDKVKKTEEIKVDRRVTIEING